MVWSCLAPSTNGRNFSIKRGTVQESSYRESQERGGAEYYGYMLGDLGIRLDEAEALVQRALKEEPFSGAYLDSLGWIYFKQGKLAASETTLRKAVERESHDATIHAHLGDLYAKMGRGDLAAAEWEKSLNEWRRSLPADVEPEKVPSWKRSSRNRSVAWRRNPLRASRNLNQTTCLKSASRRTQNQSPPGYFGKAHGWFSRTAHDFSDHFAAR